MRTPHWATLGALIVLAGSAVAADSPGRRPSDSERGEELYTRHCVACHGAKAKGDGPMAAGLVAPMPDLQGAVGGKALDDHIRVVMRGRGPMPAYEQVFDRDDAKRVVNWMANVHQRKPPKKKEAEAAEDEEEEVDLEAGEAGEAARPDDDAVEDGPAAPVE